MLDVIFDVLARFAVAAIGILRLYFLVLLSPLMSAETNNGNNDEDGVTAAAAFDVANDELSVAIVEIVFLLRMRNANDFLLDDPCQRPAK